MSPEDAHPGPSGGARLTRRRVVAAGAAGAALAAAGAALLMRPSEARGQGGDASILTSALRIEQIEIVVLEAIASSAALDGPTSALVSNLRDHERHHHAALAGPLHELDRILPEPLGAEDIEGLHGIRSARHALELVLEVELRGLAAYQDAVRRLRDGALVRLVASIMASEAQHLAVVREALGRNPIPSGLESGAPSSPPGPRLS